MTTDNSTFALKEFSCSSNNLIVKESSVLVNNFCVKTFSNCKSETFTSELRV